jgi:hypothetical protein
MLVAALTPGLLSCAADVVAPTSSVGEAAAAPFRHRLTAEYWSTDVFEEPSSPDVGPPADRMIAVSDEFAVSATDSLSVWIEDMACDAASDRTSLLVHWARVPDTGVLTGAGSSAYRDDEGGVGFAAWYDLGRRPAPGGDVRMRLRGSRSAAEAWGLSAEGRAAIALGRATASRVRVWFFGDDGGQHAKLGEVALAQHLGRGSALHASVRTYEDGGAGADRRNSTVALVELRNGSVEGTLLRASYRWYEDSEGVRAGGPSLGLERDLSDWSFGLSYRHYWTSEGVDAGTWRVMARLAF